MQTLEPVPRLLQFLEVKTSMPRIDQVQLAFPVLIEVAGTAGSGFYLSDDDGIYLVTAKHVLFKKSLETYTDPVTLTSLDGSTTGLKAVFKLDCVKLMEDGHLRKHGLADVAVCKIAKLEAKEDLGRFLKYFLTELPGVSNNEAAEADKTGAVRGLPHKQSIRFDQVYVGDEILLFGYPTSLAGEASFDRSTPLLRSGIVAGKTSGNQIVIDCPVYYGNSGGLVAMPVQYGALVGIGVASRMVHYIEKTYSPRFDGPIALRHENSGYAIVEPIDRAFELIDEIKGNGSTASTGPA
ncbi:trypsin-like peptidase domain-containing protein [Bradyrhizobium sp. S3.9.1]|uniref:trypsin-like peptidase domain-containing protein n=1 Tax=Bradyrhizobium sp. S3.9.1 TaxID=3156431 RepID=UPI00339800FB